MRFQTVFYIRSSGSIIKVVPDKYMRSKAERLSYFPGYPQEEACFLYFPSALQINPSTHLVKNMGLAKPAVIVEASGIPLIYSAWREPFLELKAKYKTIVVNMDGGLGDNLFRAATVAEAQRCYPELKFYSAVYPLELDVMSLCPDIDIIPVPWGGMKPLDIDLVARGLEPAQCGHIVLNGGHYWDPRGDGFSKSALYGLFLDLVYVPYNTRLVLPPGFAERFADFSKSVGLRKDGRNVILQLRTRETDDRGWHVDQVLELADLIRKNYACEIFYVGDPIDIPGEHQGFVNLCGKTTWLQTILLLTAASHVICIDSSVMHLCRGLGIPYFCLWGHTNPLHTLGVPPGPHDIGSDFGTAQSLMSRITPQQVFDTVFRNAPLTR